MKSKQATVAALSIGIVIAGFLFWNQHAKSPIQEFTIYDPPFVLNDVIEGKEFSDMNQSDPLETLAAFYTVTNADQMLSLYTAEELSTGSTKKVLLMGNPWEDSNFRSLSERINIVFSFRYAGKFGPQGWHVVFRDPSEKLYWTWAVCENGQWYLVMEVTRGKPEQYICNLFLKSGFREKSSLNEDEICEFRKKLKKIDIILAEENHK